MKVYLVCYVWSNMCCSESLIIRGICQSKLEADKIFNQLDMKSIDGYDLCIKEVEMDTLIDSEDVLGDILAPRREKEYQDRLLYRKKKEEKEKRDINQKHKQKYNDAICLI